MLFKKSAALLWIVVFCLSAGGVSAQDDTVRVIPVTAMTPRARLSPDGQTLVLYEDGNAQSFLPDSLYLPLRLIDLNTGTERLLTGHTDYTSDVIFTPDGTRLVSYHNNGFIRVWDVASGTTEKVIPAVVGAMRLAMLPDGKTLAVLSNLVYGQVWLWDIETGFMTSILADRPITYGSFLEQTSNGRIPRYFTFALSPDGTQFAIVDFGSTIQLWSSVTGKSHVVRQGSEKEFTLFNIRNIEFSPDGESLAYYNTDDQMFHFLNIDDGGEKTIAVVEQAHVAIGYQWNRVAWINPDDNTLVVVEIDQPDNQIVIDLPPRELNYGPTTIRNLFFIDDSHLVFSGFSDWNGENQIYVITLPS